MGAKKKHRETSNYQLVAIQLTPEQRKYLDNLAWRLSLHTGYRVTRTAAIAQLLQLAMDSHHAALHSIHPLVMQKHNMNTEELSNETVTTKRLPRLENKNPKKSHKKNT